MPWDSDVYDPSPDYALLYQGDILRDVPFPFWPTHYSTNEKHKVAILRPARNSGRALNQLPSSWIANSVKATDAPFGKFDRQEFVMGSLRMQNVMLVTRGCQIDKAQSIKHFMVAPVVAFRDRPELSNPEHLEKLKGQQVPHKFYLPPVEGLEESFADLLRVTYIHYTLITDVALKTRLTARLSSAGMGRLQRQLSDHFGVSFGFDRHNPCPQDGWYSCSACFFRGRPISKKWFTAGSPFGHCEACGAVNDESEWVKVPGLAGER